jgi:hypothetical protein
VELLGRRKQRHRQLLVASVRVVYAVTSVLVAENVVSVLDSRLDVLVTGLQTALNNPAISALPTGGSLSPSAAPTPISTVSAVNSGSSGSGSSSGSTGSLSIPAIIGIAIAVPMVLVALGVGVYVARMRRDDDRVGVAFRSDLPVAPVGDDELHRGPVRIEESGRH